MGQGVIGVMIDLALNGQSLEVWGAGKSVRDYLYSQAIIRLISYNGTETIFNIGSSLGVSGLDIVDILKRHSGVIGHQLYARTCL